MLFTLEPGVKMFDIWSVLLTWSVFLLNLRVDYKSIQHETIRTALTFMKKKNKKKKCFVFAVVLLRLLASVQVVTDRLEITHCCSGFGILDKMYKYVEQMYSFV